MENKNFVVRGKLEINNLDSGVDADKLLVIDSQGLVKSLSNSYLSSNFYSKTETSDILDGTIAITGYNKSDWDTAYSWGNHADAGYANVNHTHNYLSLNGGTLTGVLNIEIPNSGPSQRWKRTDTNAEWYLTHAGGRWSLHSMDNTNHFTIGMDGGSTDQGNKVGIGKAPSERLDVNGNIKGDSFIKSGATSNDILLGDGSTTSLATIQGDYVQKAGDTMTGALTISGVNSGDAFIVKGGDGTNNLRIDQNGDLNTFGQLNGSRVVVSHPYVRIEPKGYHMELYANNSRQIEIGSAYTTIHNTLRVKSTDDTKNVIELNSNSSNEGFMQLSNGSNWGFMARGSSNTPIIGAYNGGSLLIAGFTNNMGNTYDTELGRFWFNLRKFQVFGDIQSESYIKSGGLSTEFLKADGSVDNTTYETPSGAQTKADQAESDAIAWVKSKGFGDGLPDRSNIDLNDITETSVIFAVAGCTNLPINDHTHVFTQYNSDTSITQLAMPTGNPDGKFYIRTKNNWGWTEWKEIADTGYVDTLISEVKEQIGESISTTPSYHLNGAGKYLTTGSGMGVFINEITLIINTTNIKNITGDSGLIGVGDKIRILRRGDKIGFSIYFLGVEGFVDYDFTKNTVFTLTVKNDQVIGYANGEVIYVDTLNNTSWTYNEPLLIGKNNTAHLEGDVHFAQVYNTALSQDQIKQIGNNPDNIPYELTGVDGSELVTNGGFDTDTNWNKTTQVTISGGTGNIISTDGSYQYLLQTTVTKPETTYLLTYDIVSNNNGALKFSQGTNTYGSLPSTVGTHTIIFKATGTNLYIERQGGVTDISIDNVSLVKVGVIAKYGNAKSNDVWYNDVDDSRHLTNYGAELYNNPEHFVTTKGHFTEFELNTKEINQSNIFSVNSWRDGENKPTMTINSAGGIGFGTTPYNYEDGLWVGDMPILINGPHNYIAPASSNPTHSLNIKGYADMNVLSHGTNIKSSYTGIISFSTKNPGTDYTPIERLRIDDNGNVGIGTTTPSYNLEVDGETKLNNLIVTGEGLSGGADVMLRTTHSGAQHIKLEPNSRTKFGGDVIVPSDKMLQFGGTQNHITTANGSGRMDFKSFGYMVFNNTSTYSTGYYDFRIQDVSRFKINTDGNVGIGITNPSEKLEVDGNVLANSFIKSGGSSTEFLKADGSIDSNIYTTEATNNSRYLKLTGGTLTGSLSFTPTGPTTQIASVFTGTTYKSYINFNAAPGSNDPGFIVHETSSGTNNKGVIHISPSDDNADNDYVTIHGTNDPETIKLHTSGKIETPGNIYANSFIKSGATSSDVLLGDGSTKNINELGDGSYVNVSGDTMTGKLSITNTTGFSAKFDRGVEFGTPSYSWFFGAGNATVFAHSTIHESSTYHYDKNLDPTTQQGWITKNTGGKFIIGGIVGGAPNHDNTFVINDGKVGISKNDPYYLLDLGIDSSSKIRAQELRLSGDNGNSTARIYGESYGDRSLTYHAGYHKFVVSASQKEVMKLDTDERAYFRNGITTGIYQNSEGYQATRHGKFSVDATLAGSYKEFLAIDQWTIKAGHLRLTLVEENRGHNILHYEVPFNYDDVNGTTTVWSTIIPISSTNPRYGHTTSGEHGNGEYVLQCKKVDSIVYLRLLVIDTDSGSTPWKWTATMTNCDSTITHSASGTDAISGYGFYRHSRMVQTHKGVGIDVLQPQEKLHVDGNIKIGDGASIKSDGNISLSANSGTNSITLDTWAGQTILLTSESMTIRADGNLAAEAGNAFVMRTNNTNRWAVDTFGHLLPYGSSDNVYNIGGGGAQIKNIFTYSVENNNSQLSIGNASYGSKLNGLVEANGIWSEEINGTRDVVRVVNPKGGVLSFDGGNTTGAIKIALPTGSENVMFRVKLDIYSYTTPATYTSLIIGGYAYATTFNWVHTFATIIAGDESRDLKVRFGDDGTDFCMWIGETTTEWINHTQVSISEVTASWSGANKNIGEGWKLSLIQLFDTIKVTKTNNLPFGDYNKLKNLPTTLSGFGLQSEADDRYVNIGGDTMTGPLKINGGGAGSDVRLIVGSGSNGTLSTRHIEGKHWDNDSPHDLYINNYSNSNVFLVTGGGKVGIGLAGPSERLHVAGNVLADSFIKSGGTGTNVLLDDGTVKPLSYFETEGDYLLRDGSLQMTGRLNMANNLIDLRTNSGDIAYLGFVSPYIQLYAQNRDIRLRVDNGNDIQMNLVGNGGLFKVQDSGVDVLTVDTDGNTTANSFIKEGGSSTQFLKADGSVDDNTYALDSYGVSGYHFKYKNTFTKAAGGGISWIRIARLGLWVYQEIFKITATGDNSTCSDIIEYTGAGYAMGVKLVIKPSTKYNNSKVIGYAANVNDVDNKVDIWVKLRENTEPTNINVFTQTTEGTTIIEQTAEPTWNTDNREYCYLDNADSTQRYNENLILSDKIRAGGYKVHGGNSSHFLKGDGTVDSTTYIESITPITPPNITTSIVGENVEIAFDASTTPDIDQYVIFSSVDGGSYGLISVVPPEDFSTSMTVIDGTFSVSGTMDYRVYAVKNGVYSTPATSSVVFTAPTLEPTNLSIIPSITNFVIQWDDPDSRFIASYNIYKHADVDNLNLSRANATLVYSGNENRFIYNINEAELDYYHQFWVETITT